MTKQRRAFVRTTSGDFNESWTTLEQAERFAQQYASDHRGQSYYTGYIGSDPREHSRWEWSGNFHDVVRYTCND